MFSLPCAIRLYMSERPAFNVHQEDHKPLRCACGMAVYPLRTHVRGRFGEGKTCQTLFCRQLPSAAATRK